jgi:hypothetical protein
MGAVGQGVGNRIESAREGSFPSQCQSSNQEPVSNPSMRVFELRRPVAFLALLFVTILAGANSTSHRLYLNLLEICDFMSEDNPEAADRVEDAVLRACDLSASSPLAGRARKDLTSLPLRFWVVQPYSIYLIRLRP